MDAGVLIDDGYEYSGGASVSYVGFEEQMPVGFFNIAIGVHCAVVEVCGQVERGWSLLLFCLFRLFHWQ